MVKVSVIVPVYNVEKYLERCLNSILKQTLTDIEIICVNDGSTDNSGYILEEYQSNGKIKIINQENAGLSEARNTGLKYAQGEFVSFIDSDDFIDKNFIETLYMSAIKENADIACASIVRENNRKKNILINYTEVKKAVSIKEKYNLVCSPQYNFVWNKIYRRNCLIDKNISFIPGMIYEDMWFTPDILEKLGTIVACPNTYYHYWKHKDSLIKGDCDKYRADKLLGSEYLRSKYLKYGINSNIRNELLFKEDVYLFGINILRIKNYRATKKYYLFGILPFLEMRRKV